MGRERKEVPEASELASVFHARSHDITVEAFLENAFENPRGSYKIFVCQIGDKLAGYIDSRVSMGVGLILGIYVKQKHRRKGIGKSLMMKTINEFTQMGCHKTRLEVFADNHVAIQFYSTLNFDREGFLREDEEKKDIIIMSRFLS